MSNALLHPLGTAISWFLLCQRKPDFQLMLLNN